MVYSREPEQSAAAAEAALGVVRLADRVCEATDQAALDRATSALSTTTERTPVLPDTQTICHRGSGHETTFK